MKTKTLLITAFMVISLFLPHKPVLCQTTGPLQQVIKERLASRRIFDEAALPSDPRQRQWRLDKCKRYNKNSPFSLLDTSERSVHVDSFPNDIFPFSTSSLVILGTIEGAQSFLSENKTNVYTEYIIRIEEVFKNSVGLILKPTNLINVDIEAGSLRLSSGLIVKQEIVNLIMPEIGQRGVFFLNLGNGGSDLYLRRGFEITDNYILQLDNPSNSTQFIDFSNVQFIETVRTTSRRSNK